MPVKVVYDVYKILIFGRRWGLVETVVTGEMKNLFRVRLVQKPYK